MEDYKTRPCHSSCTYVFSLTTVCIMLYAKGGGNGLHSFIDLLPISGLSFKQKTIICVISIIWFSEIKVQFNGNRWNIWFGEFFCQYLQAYLNNANKLALVWYVLITNALFMLHNAMLYIYEYGLPKKPCSMCLHRSRAEGSTVNVMIVMQRRWRAVASFASKRLHYQTNFCLSVHYF